MSLCNYRVLIRPLTDCDGIAENLRETVVRRELNLVLYEEFFPASNRFFTVRDRERTEVCNDTRRKNAIADDTRAFFTVRKRLLLP